MASTRRSWLGAACPRRSTRWSAAAPSRFASTYASDARLPEQVELAAYYVVAEALTNAAKHAAASEVHIDVGG